MKRRAAERWVRAGMSWLRASPTERWSSLQVLTLWAGTELALHRFSLPVVCRALGVELGAESVELGAEGGAAPAEEALANSDPRERPLELERRIQRAMQQVDRVLRTARPRSACLRRSLLLGYLLRDLDPVLRIGVARADGAFEAHAWLEVARVPVPEPGHVPGRRSFVPLRRFQGTSAPTAAAVPRNRGR